MTFGHSLYSLLTLCTSYSIPKFLSCYYSIPLTPDLNTGKDFMNATWLFAEAYKYRRLRECFSVSKYWRNYDVFFRQKVRTKYLSSVLVLFDGLYMHFLILAETSDIATIWMLIQIFNSCSCSATPSLARLMHCWSSLCALLSRSSTRRT